MEGNELILKAPEGLSFRVREVDRRTIEIEVLHDYQKPVIPSGFKYVRGEWNNGFTIKSEIDESEFVWLPVGSLEADGSLDNGETFCEKFGRRPITGVFHNEYEDIVPDDLLDSVNKYGGVWFSAYTASQEKEGCFAFKKGAIPFHINVTREIAQKAAIEYAEKYKGVRSCLPSEAGYDTLFKWLIKTSGMPEEKFTTNSKEWGNYTGEVLVTGSSEKYCVNNIYDLAGNCLEITGATCHDYITIKRSGIGGWGRICGPATDHGYADDTSGGGVRTTFRILLYME